MLLNKTLSTIFVFVFIFRVNASENESDSESDEDDKLKQALVLVEILKKEYLKLLQSQHVIQQQLQQLQQQQHVGSVTTTEVLPAVNDATYETKPEHQAAKYLTRVGSGQEIPSLLNGRRANKVPIDKVWNKKFLANYRRALSEPVNETMETTIMPDGNKENDAVNMATNKTGNVSFSTPARHTKEKRIHKATVNKIKNVTKAVRNKKLTKNSVKNHKFPTPKNKPVLRDAADVKPDDNGNNKNAAEVNPEENGNMKQNATEGNPEVNAEKDQNVNEVKPGQNVSEVEPGQNVSEVKSGDSANKKQNTTEVKPEDSTSKKQNATEAKPKGKPTKDPVMDQVQSELDNELKEDGASKSYKKKLKTPHMPKNTFLDVRPTLRIHLARSTRLPIPFSENNAFCYYVPHSPLCIGR